MTSVKARYTGMRSGQKGAVALQYPFFYGDNSLPGIVA
jgi:hypothetical protein